MKRSILMFLVIGVTIMFSGCSKDNTLATDLVQSDQVTNSLKTQEVTFTGQCTFLALLDGGDTTFLPNGKIKITGYISQWKDTADDWRVTGVSTWYMNWLIEEDGITAKVWGHATIVVDGENPGDETRGEWKLSFHGNVTPTSIGFDVVDVCVGQGKEGEVKGLVAKWWHEMNFDFSNPGPSFVYNFEGYIVE